MVLVYDLVTFPKMYHYDYESGIMDKHTIDEYALPQPATGYATLQT